MHNLVFSRTGVAEVLKLRKMGLGQAEQLCTLGGQASVEVSLGHKETQTIRHTAVFVELLLRIKTLITNIPLF